MVGLRIILASLLVSSVTADSSEVHESANFCKLDKDQSIGEACDVTIREINVLNSNIRPSLELLTSTNFFRYFKLDLYKDCPFWDDNNGQCANRACAVDEVDDWDSVPEIWQPEVLGSFNEETVKREKDDECSFLDELCGDKWKGSVQGNDYDYCDVDDESAEGSVLIDLKANPERFTGYGGEQSSQIWSSIYKENCFSIEEKGRCLAKDVFYRLVSGLHASIATHLSNEYLNVATGKWEPNLELFMARVGNFPERISNIYFNFAIVAKALWKIQPYLGHIKSCKNYDETTKQMIGDVIFQLHSRIFNEDLLFQDDISLALKDDFRTRFKNVTRIMDCVHCDRCRLWGKVQTTGYATSLKILFEMDSTDEQKRQQIVDKLTKYELIALFNTFDRISKSVASINNFEQMYYKANGNKSKISSNNFFNLFKKIGVSSSSFARQSESSSDQESIKFSDLKMPVQKVADPSRVIQPKGRWRAAWDSEMERVKEGLLFFWNSYLSLPRNLSYMVLSKVNKWFNMFIGVENYFTEDIDGEFHIDL